MIGARGTITECCENFGNQFGLDYKLTENIIVLTNKGY